MNDENEITRLLREAGSRYVVDAQQRPLGYLLTPEEYTDYLNMLLDREDRKGVEGGQPSPEATRAHQGTRGQQLLIFAGSIPADDLLTMQQAIDADCETVDAHEW